jgi:hypothetical protein
MKHPKSRADRRSVRRNWIARRKYVVRYVWRLRWEFKPEGFLSKYNLNCGCIACHSLKHFKAKRQRRRQLDQEILFNLESWGFDWNECILPHWPYSVI